MTLKRVLKEPLLHFLLAGGAIFLAYTLINADAWTTSRITVTAAKINQMSEIFARTRQRPPSSEELKAMIDDYVKEELYVREALALGLDKDDTVIRRRLRQKMEFLGNAEAESTNPTDDELQSYLAAHPTRFEVEPQVAVEQVFLSAERHADTIEADAGAMLAKLQSKPDTDISTLGDPTMLPAALPLSRLSVIGETYGPEVSEAVRDAAVGQWLGPVRSSYGFHLIRVTERKPGRSPALAEVRDAVKAEWIQAKRQEFEDRRLADMLKRFEVVIEPTTTAAGTMP